MLGSVGVLIGALIIKFTGWKVADPIIAVLIGLWVLPRTWTLLREAGQVLMQGVPHGLELDEVRTMMLSHPNVTAVHDLHAWALGSKEPVLTAHIVLRDGGDGEQVRRSLAAALEERFNVHHATLQVEMTPCDEAHGHV
jgi:cobalt-zinc-cadmium efflux system protein